MAQKGFLKQATEAARLPEMRVFWVILVLLVVILVTQALYFPPYLTTIGAVVFFGVAAVVFRSVAQAARVGRETTLERNQLRSIVFGMKDALIVYDTDFKIMFFNPAAEKMFGLSGDMVIGNVIAASDVEKPGFKRLVQTVFPTLAPAMVRKSKAGEYPQIVDLSFDDPYQEVRTTTSPITGDDGALAGFMKIARDRTRELSLLKSKNEFITVASHQLRTPITNIHWVLESVLKDESLSEDKRELIENAFSSAKTLRTVVEQLLDISKIEEGRFGYDLKEVDIAEFLGTILSELLPQARRVGIALYFDRPEEPLPKVTIDKEKLSMAVLNILDNAIKYNVENGTVTVRVKKREDGPFVEVSVRDTGIGVPDEDMKKLFGKFFRAGNAVKAVADGSGLGLYITQNIIRSHGGTVWAESELGRGTTFHFTLPTDPTMIPPREVAVVE